MNAQTIQTVDAPELARWLKDPSRPSPQILDVRENWELEICSLPQAIHIPMGEVSARLDELHADQAVVCLCHHGVRSNQIALFLNSRGFQTVYNMQGGINAWSELVDPQCPRY